MKAEFKTITPEYARELLDESARAYAKGEAWQRPISLKHARRLANQIELGLWATTHQGIGINQRGIVIDGSHRLTGCVLAKKPIKVLVVSGIPDTNELGICPTDAIDRHRCRTVNQSLTKHGYPRAQMISSIANAIISLCSTSTKYIPTVECGQVIKIHDLYKREFDTILESLTRSEKRATVIAPIIALARVHRDECIDFANKYSTMENIPSGHPILAFKRWDANHHGTHGDRKDRRALMNAVCVALKAHVSGEKLDKIFTTESARNWLLGLDKAFVRKVSAISEPTLAA